MQRAGVTPNRFDHDILLCNKDSCVQEANGKLLFLYRLDPNMHAIVLESLNHLRDQEFWKDVLGELSKEHTFLQAREMGEGWASLKAGWGTGLINIEGRLIALVHGVEQTHKYETHGSSRFVYKGTFVEADKTNPTKAISVMRDPLHEPTTEEFHTMECIKGDGKRERKDVIFPTALVVEDDTLCCYSGLADCRIGYRSTNKRWVLDSLSHEHNRINRK